MKERAYSLSQYPLSWPDGWTRTPAHQVHSGKFLSNKQQPSVMTGITRVIQQLGSMGISREDVLISTNIPTRLDGMPRSDQREPGDHGVAVYWRKGQDGVRQCIAIDIYNRVADNLCAVAATLEALRAIERHGGAQVQERSFRGFAALPAGSGRPWRDVLRFDSGAHPDRELIEERFRFFARERHPDVGGNDEGMAELNQAREEALREIG